MVTLAGAILNIGCNLLLVPVLGIWGAAITTLVTYFLMAFSTYLLALRKMKIDLYPGSMLKAILFSSVMLAILMAIGNPFPWTIANLIVKTVIGAASYFLLVIAFDTEVRETLTRYVRG
jgi:O-antigen/teichoic acid export membrane protein